jgi:hypothetical protein
MFIYDYPQTNGSFFNHSVSAKLGHYFHLMCNCSWCQGSGRSQPIRFGDFVLRDQGARFLDKCRDHGWWVILQDENGLCDPRHEKGRRLSARYNEIDHASRIDDKPLGICVCGGDSLGKGGHCQALESDRMKAAGGYRDQLFGITGGRGFTEIEPVSDLNIDPGVLRPERGVVGYDCDWLLCSKCRGSDTIGDPQAIPFGWWWIDPLVLRVGCVVICQPPLCIPFKMHTVSSKNHADHS